MNRRLLTTLLVLIGCTTWVQAESDTKPAAQSDSPKQTLKAQDAAARSGSVEADEAFYQAEGDQQKKLTHSIAAGDVAVARLEAAVDKQFGKDLAAAVVRAAGSEAISAVDSATERVDGDRAMVQFHDQPAAIPMIRADGKWKISLSDWVKETKSEQVDQLIASMEKLTTEIQHITSLVDKEKFRSGEGVRDRVQTLHDQLFPRPAR
jgi:hypothetical protein